MRTDHSVGIYIITKGKEAVVRSVDGQAHVSPSFGDEVDDGLPPAAADLTGCRKRRVFCKTVRDTVEVVCICRKEVPCIQIGQRAPILKTFDALLQPLQIHSSSPSDCRPVRSANLCFNILATVIERGHKDGTTGIKHTTVLSW